MVKNPPAMWETWVRSLGWKGPLKKGMTTHSSVLAWRIRMDRGAWQAIVQGGHKESDMTEQLSTAQYFGGTQGLCCFRIQNILRTEPNSVSLLPWFDSTSAQREGVPIIGAILGFPGGSDSKESTYNARDAGLIPVSGRSPGEGHGNTLQYSCLGNPMDRGAWWATVSPWAHKESDTTEQLTHVLSHCSPA